MNDKQKYFVLILVIAVITVTIVGATFAYWSWSTNSAQSTAVTFTVSQGFSCSADGGGNITSNDVELMPTSCTDTTHAIKRTVVVSPSITRDNLDIYLDLNLKVNSISSNLAATTYFKYALTTSSTNCTSGVVTQGDFYGAAANTEKILLHNKEYSTTGTDTYYLWIWLDSAESNNNTQNQTFNITLSGSCTDEEPTTFSGTIYRHTDDNVIIGKSIKQWCAVVESASLNTCIHNDYGNMTFDSEAECETFIDSVLNNPNSSQQLISFAQVATCEQRNPSYETEATKSNITYPYYVKHIVVDDIVTESYVEFVITPEMVADNPGLTAGTYDLRGLDIYDYLTGICKSQYLDDGYCRNPYNDTNMQILRNAFGANNGYCIFSAAIGANSYSGLTCRISNFVAGANSERFPYALDSSDGDSYCAVTQYGIGRCWHDSGNGSGVDLGNGFGVS